MSITSSYLFRIPNSQISIASCLSREPHLKTPYVPLRLAPKTLLNLSRFHPRKAHFTILGKAKHGSDYSDWTLRVKPIDLDVATAPLEREDYSFDAVLSLVEISCLVSSVAISVLTAVNSRRRTLILPWLGENGLVWQCVFLVGGVFLGAVIRRRQWRRLCAVGFLSRPVNLLGRIEKVEQDLKSSSTMLRFMSRQLEKLGIRFRLTRKALKDPIAETATLAQKNSEATRALAMQEDVLEKELGELQKVLLAMQEQQQKQLELILAIAKSGKLWDHDREKNHGNYTAVASNPPADGGVPLLKKNQTLNVDEV